MNLKDIKIKPLHSEGDEKGIALYIALKDFVYSKRKFPVNYDGYEPEFTMLELLDIAKEIIEGKNSK